MQSGSDANVSHGSGELPSSVNPVMCEVPVSVEGPSGGFAVPSNVTSNSIVPFPSCSSGPGTNQPIYICLQDHQLQSLLKMLLPKQQKTNSSGVVEVPGAVTPHGVVPTVQRTDSSSNATGAAVVSDVGLGIGQANVPGSGASLNKNQPLNSSHRTDINSSSSEESAHRAGQHIRKRRSRSKLALPSEIQTSRRRSSSSASSPEGKGFKSHWLSRRSAHSEVPHASGSGHSLSSSALSRAQKPNLATWKRSGIQPTTPGPSTSFATASGSSRRPSGSPVDGGQSSRRPDSKDLAGNYVFCEQCYDTGCMAVTDSCEHAFHKHCLLNKIRESKQQKRVFKTCPKCLTKFNLIHPYTPR